MFEKKEVIIDEKSVSVLIEKQLQENTLSSPRPICFVVGLSSHYHDKFSEKFRAFYQLVLIDLYWTDSQFSAAYTEKLDMDSLSEHIELVRKQLNNKLGESYQKIFIAAHSAYGFISIDYALKYPDKLLGIINIASPLIFNEKVLIEWQELYLYSNFGSPKAGGPTDRFYSYYEQKNAFAKQKAAQSKHYFVNWYLSMGPLLWQTPNLWKNKNDQAAKIWEPWKVPVFDSKTGTSKLETRDLNMPMLFRYMELVTNMDCYNKICNIQVPVLWIISLHDSRVSLYQLEDKRKSSIPENIEFFHPVQESHWPMYPGDSDTTEFDDKALSWGCGIFQNRPSFTANL
jgi:pimeloyl-ACP methyl ester carboxylesterase